MSCCAPRAMSDAAAFTAVVVAWKAEIPSWRALSLLFAACRVSKIAECPARPFETYALKTLAAGAGA